MRVPPSKRHSRLTPRSHPACLAGVMDPHADVSESSFVVEYEGAAVPGTLWTPDGRRGPVPLVLLAHGGSGDRRSARNLALAEGITRAGLAAAAIDSPYHGERVPAPLTPAEYQPRIVAEGVERVLDRIAGEWCAARDALVDTGVADPTRQAYVGLSLGTRFGLAAAVALGPALRCAVFGKFGTRAAPALPAGLGAPERALADAGRITAPVLFQLPWDDELFPRAGQLELFDAFGSPAKELHAFAGGHRVTPAHAPAARLAFLIRHLA